MSTSIAGVVNRMAPRAVNDATPSAVDAAARAKETQQSGTSDAVAKTEGAPKLDPQIVKLEEAARQFEAIFVRQLLKTAKFGGKSAKSGHGQMAVDAMANSISESGGLGLSTHIRDVLLKAHLAKAASEK